MIKFDEKVFQEKVWKFILEKLLKCGKENFTTTKQFVLEVIDSGDFRDGLQDCVILGGFWGWIASKLKIKALLVNKPLNLLSDKLKDLSWEEIIK